jgi:hypothetical protein
LRTIVGTLVGILVAFVLVVAVELSSAVVHPLPEGFGGTMEEMCEHVGNYPQWVLAVVVAAWAGTACVATWAARKLGNVYSFAGVGLLLLAGVAFNLAKLPYPFWFKIANLLAIPAAVIAGGRLAKPTKTTSIAEPG